MQEQYPDLLAIDKYHTIIAVVV